MKFQGVDIRAWLRASRQGSTYLGAILIGLMWASVLAYLHADRTRAIEAATQRTATFARAYQDYTRRSLREVDKTLLILRTAFQSNPAGFDLPAFTRNSYFLNDVTLQVALIGADGRLVSTNLGPQPTPVDLSDREHFAVQRDAATDRLFISKPVLGRASGKWSIQLTRRLTDSEGRFAGVLVASIDPGHFEAFHDTMEIGDGGAVTIVGDDGVLRARGSRSGESVLGRSITGTELFQKVSGADQGTLVAASPIDGVMRITSFRVVADYPLKVMVSVPMSGVRGVDDARRDLWLALASMLTLGVIAAVVRSIANQRSLDLALEALRMSEAGASAKSVEFHATLENISQGIMMIDAGQRVAVVNRQAIRLLGLPEEFLTSRPSFDEVLQYQWKSGEFGEQGEKLEPKVLSFIRAGGASDEVTVYERTRPNGTVLEIRTLALPDGGVVRTYSDVTERSQNAAALAEARDRAEAATRARTAFLAMMSHEIRTPLNGVIGMAGLLAETDLDSEQRRYTGTLRDSAEHLLQVIDDVLDFSKLEADRGTFEEVQFDLEKTIDSMLGIVAPRARDKGLFLGATIAHGVPDMVVGDAGALRQILLNLVGNGVKFTPAGSVIVEVEPEPAMVVAPDRVALRFSVRDTGIGIPQEAMPALFQEFSQLDGSIARRFGGTGLGLAISKHLVERFGGTIGLSSIPGEGSTFTFTMTLGRAEGATRLDAPRALLGQRWLVLAGDQRLGSFHVALLQAEGAVVDIAAETVAAAKLIEAAEPAYDALLVDQHGLPVDSSLLAALVHDAPLKTPERFVLVTGLAGKAALDDDIRDLFDHVLSTPVSRQSLRECLAARDPQPRPKRMQVAVENAPRTILLAEDNRTNRLVAESLLAKLGYRCVTAMDGLEAVERVRAGGIDCVLMDLMMPELDGFGATRAIRALPAPLCDTPIVALTANVLTADWAVVKAAGMNGFATKPITRDKLGQVLAKALAGNPPTVEGSKPVSQDLSDYPAFDKDAMAAIRAELDADSLALIFEAFLQDTESRIAVISTSGSDPGLAAREAHALKSAAATFGFMRLAHLAEQIEVQAARLTSAALRDLAFDMQITFAQARISLLPDPPGSPGAIDHPPDAGPRAKVA